MVKPKVLILDDDREIEHIYKYADCKYFCIDGKEYSNNEVEFIICRTVSEASTYLLLKGLPQFMSLDHDLGLAPDGMSFVKWLCEEDEKGTFDLTKIEIQYHSGNYHARLNMQSYVESYLKAKE